MTTHTVAATSKALRSRTLGRTALVALFGVAACSALIPRALVGAPAGIEDRAAKVGAVVSDFRLPATLGSGGTFQLGDALRSGPVVLVFYRGQW